MKDEVRTDLVLSWQLGSLISPGVVRDWNTAIFAAHAVPLADYGIVENAENFSPSGEGR